MKLYLAGPEVFLPDAADIGKVKQELCRRHGFIGLFPLDNESDPGEGGSLSRTIFVANIAMLDDADAIVANLSPFRGASADAGTIFEVGYGYARGKKVFGYSNVRTSFVERVQRLVKGEIKKGPDGRRYAADGLAVEEFDRFDNLMIAEALLASGANIVLPEAAPADPWRDMQVFEQTLAVIRDTVGTPTRFVIAR
jgi:nucleoside 2-deoxyribosyltransferase